MSQDRYGPDRNVPRPKCPQTETAQTETALRPNRPDGKVAYPCQLYLSLQTIRIYN